MSELVGGRGMAEGASDTTALFVGRKAELELLGAQVAKARAGEPAVVAIEGAAGMGKTALVRRALCLAADFQVVTATADESESRLAGGTVAQLMGGTDCATQSQTLRALEAAPDPFAAGVKLLDLLGRLQDQGPVAIVVDDVQWADSVSVTALAFTLRRLQIDHVLAIFVAREEPPGLPDGLRRLIDAKAGLSLHLDGLRPQDVSELGAAMSGRRLSGRAAQRLCAHTGGNPLHARALLEELGEPALEDSGAVLPAPRSFAKVILARLAGSAPDTIDLVQAAAVLGQRCSVSTAAAVARVGDPCAAVDEAVAVHMLDLHPHREVAFVHPLVRAAVYGDLGPSRRVALHTRAAEVLDGPVALFHRVEAALIEDPALATDVEAHARRELARGALASGADALLTAARLTVDPGLRMARELDALEALLAAGEVARAASVAGEMDCTETPRGCYLLSHLALFSGRLEEAERLLGKAWSLCGMDSDARLRALVAAGRAQICSAHLRSAEAAEWARQAIDASADPELTTTALSILVPCLGRVGRPAEAFAAATSLPAGGDRDSDTIVHDEAILSRGMVRLWVGDLAEARADMAAVVAACRDRPASRQALVALGMLADLEFRLGSWDDSLVHAEKLVSLVEDSEQVWVGAFAHAAATWVRAPRGDFEGAKAHARAAVEAGRVLGDAISLGCAATAGAHAAFFEGDLPAAVRAVQPMLDLGARAAEDDPGVHPWRELHAEALLRLGRLDEAEAALDALETLAVARDRRSSLASAARLRAGLQTARGEHDAARAGFESAVTQTTELGIPFEQARAHDDYGRFLRRRGERRAATAHLGAAWEGFTALGAEPLAQRCQQELAACGLNPSARTGRPLRELTPQELAVARLVSAGHTNREVAAELVVSPKTVEYHLSNAYAKLGVRSRTQLVARLAAIGH